jgi:hypothetical protein
MIRTAKVLLVFGLTVSAAAQPVVDVVTTVDAPSIAGRPVALDAQGKLLPFPMPESTGYSYSGYFLSQWTILWDQYNRQRFPYYYCCFNYDRTTFEMYPEQHWANSTGYLRAMMQGFMERLYPYTGDRRTLTFIRDLVDYELANGLTPKGYAWAEVPYPSANPGSPRYTGWSQHGEDYVEPHVVGEDGYGYLRLYEMTGDTRYLAAAIRCAEALVKNFKPGDEQNSPWPYRCFARDGSITGAGTNGMFAYSANVVEPIMLFDELIRLHQGDTESYQRIREGAWAWLMKYPMQNNVWVGYFEDVKASMGNMNQVIPLEFARYVLLHPEKDPQWREHARQLIDWVKTTPRWPKYMVHGALVTTEQGSSLKNYCCNPPNECCDSHSSRLAAVEALYYAKTGDLAYKEQAYRTYNWVSYFQGLPRDGHAPFTEQWWFTDEYSDGPRRMMDGFWAVPEWAPADESHLLGSLSVVTNMAYGAGAVTYSTFDADSTDVLRLNFVPQAITVDGKLIQPRTDPSQEGYVFHEDNKTLTIHHTSGKNIDIHGESENRPPLYVTFDNPHLAAGTPLAGQYPSGVIDWGEGEWQIGTPDGKFGTFTLRPADPAAQTVEFAFPATLIFAGIDVYNSGDQEATVTIRSNETHAQTYTLKPKELRRLRTAWRDPSTSVAFDLKNGAGLIMDNLAYLHP